MVKEDKKEYFMCQYSVFYGEYENEKKTGQKHLTFPDGDLNPGFLNKICILREIGSIELTVLRKSRLYQFLKLCTLLSCGLKGMVTRKQRKENLICFRFDNGKKLVWPRKMSAMDEMLSKRIYEPVVFAGHNC